MSRNVVINPQNEILLTKKLILRTDKNFMINFVSKSFRDFTYMTNHSLVSKSFEDILYFFVPKIVLEEMYKNLKKNFLFFHPMIFKMENGFYFWADVEVYAINKSGNFTKKTNEVDGYLFFLKELNSIDKQHYINKFQDLKMKEILHLKI